MANDVITAAERVAAVRAASPKVIKKHKRLPENMRSFFQAAKASRLNSTWSTSMNDPNYEIKTDIKSLIARSRDLAKNNPYMSQYFKMVQTNVVGATGIKLQMRVIDRVGDKFEKKPDKFANTVIESSWKDWGKLGSPTMDGGMSWHDVEKLAVQSVARDGEIFFRKIKGRQAPNKYGFALQPLEADYVDMDYSVPNNRIDQGIEYNEWGRPVAYYVLTSHPSNQMGEQRKRIRVPADQIIHLYLPQRAGQRRGVPWAVSVMEKLRQLDGYFDAELTAARVSAAKMGFFTSPDGDSYDPDGVDSYGNLITDAEAGTFEQLAEGTVFTPFDPQHPTSAFESFVKAVLRSIASGLGVVYPSLANDLEGVNFSSIRHGALEERDNWRMVQKWLMQHLHQQVFEEWLETGLSLGTVGNLPLARFEKFNQPTWRPRGWAWVDPKKDAEANILMREEGLKSRSEAAAEMGRDFEETVEQIKSENEVMDEAGLSTSEDLQGDQDDEQD